MEQLAELVLDQSHRCLCLYSLVCALPRQRVVCLLPKASLPDTHQQYRTMIQYTRNSAARYGKVTCKERCLASHSHRACSGYWLFTVANVPKLTMSLKLSPQSHPQPRCPAPCQNLLLQLTQPRTGTVLNSQPVAQKSRDCHLRLKKARSFTQEHTCCMSAALRVRLRFSLPSSTVIASSTSEFSTSALAGQARARH